MRIAILAALALVAVSSSAYANCRKPGVPAEYVVCSDHALIKLVEKRREVYRVVHDRLPKKQQRALYADHWHWLNAYPERCGVGKHGKPSMPINPAIVACFKREMKARIAYLRGYPHAAAAQAHPAQAEKAEAEKAKAEARAKEAEKARAVAKARAEKAKAEEAAKAEAAAKAKAKAAAQAKAEAAEKAAEQARKAAEAAVAEAARAKAEAARKAKAEANCGADACVEAERGAGRPGEPIDAGRAAAANGESVPALPGSGQARYHLKFTFACRTRAELARVLASLSKNDFSYALSQPECLPVPDGRPARLLSVDGKVARVRLCSPATGCTDVYADASTVLDAKNQPVGH